MRYLPILLAVIAIASASALDLLSNFDLGGEAEAWARVIEEGVPYEIGPWVGKDREDDDTTLVTAGAVGKVHRQYTNQETGESVTVWLICGHMQAVARHAPTVCYKASEYKQKEPQNRHQFEAEGKASENQFWTSWFLRELPGTPVSSHRVFWAWANPKSGEQVAWGAPAEARYEYPGARALFKLYFTTNEPEDPPPLAENPSNDLAKHLLPVLADLFEAGPENFQPVADTAGSDAGNELESDAEPSDAEPSDAEQGEV